MYWEGMSIIETSLGIKLIFWEKKKMKRTHFCCALLITVLFINTFVNADNIYVSAFEGQSCVIYKYDSFTGQRTTFPTHMMCPWSLAADKSGNIYSTNLNDKIYKFTPQGSETIFADAIDCASLAFDKNDNLYVTCDYATGLIQKFDPSGNGTIIATGLGDNPKGIALDNYNNIYVLTGGNGNGSLVKFDEYGNKTILAASPYSPRELYFDSVTSSLWAAGWQEFSNYDLNGNKILSYNVPGGWPWGGCFDSQRNLFVTDCWLGNIYKYDTNGNRTLFASGLDSPYGIVIVPEPMTMMLIAVGGMMIRRFNA